MRRALMGLAVFLGACGGPAPVLPVDAGAPGDAGPVTDAGAVSDAGLTADAGPGPDAGTGPDAGAVSDAGTGTDAGPVTDAGLTADAGVPDAGVIRTGALVGGAGPWPGFIAGLSYRSGTQAGTTDDAGTFTWQDGVPVTFSIGDIDFAATAGRPKLSPWQLTKDGGCGQSAELERMLVLIHSLDVDGDPATGTALAPSGPTATQRPFASLTDTDVAAAIASKFPGRTPVAPLEAVDRFIRQMDHELWSQKSLDTFNGTTGGTRSQGVVSNGTSWFFSWTYGLERTDLAFNVTKSNTLAIPLALSIAGSNHIGDIDLNGNTLWAPIEDGSAYAKPYLVEYDATTLVAGTTHALSNTLLTKGVPWVAVDAARSSLYVAEWDPTPGIYVYALNGVVYQRTIPIRPALTRIQGAKVFEGSLYANLDDAMKTVFKINLETGTAQALFTMPNASGIENEGIAFLARPDGTLLHTTNANAARTAVEFRHHERTRAPLRASVCP